MSKRSARPRVLALLATGAIICGSCVPAAACPTCGQGLVEHGLAAGYSWSILLMAALPFAVLLGWTLAIVRVVRSVRSGTLPAAGEWSLQECLHDETHNR